MDGNLIILSGATMGYELRLVWEYLSLCQRAVWLGNIVGDDGNGKKFNCVESHSPKIKIASLMLAWYGKACG
jgi:hypothetical protein